MKVSQLKIGDTFNFHSQPKQDLEKIVPLSIQNLTYHPDNHSGTYLDDNMVIGALAQGYTPLPLEQAIIQGVDTVKVYRYHADRDELTTKQQDGLIRWCYDHQGVPYDYLDIVALAILMEVNDTTWESFILRKIFAWGLTLAEDVINDFVKINKNLLDKIMGQAVKADKGLLICSQAAKLALSEGAGVPLRILNDEGRKKYLPSSGAFYGQFKEINKQDILNPDESFFCTPRDIAMCPDLNYIGTLTL